MKQIAIPLLAAVLVGCSTGGNGDIIIDGDTNTAGPQTTDSLGSDSDGTDSPTDSEPGDSDTGADGDSDTDTDTDTDADTDVDTDTDTDTDTDVDTDTDTDVDSDADADADGGPDAADDSEEPDTTCGSAEVKFELQPLTVMLLIDQSGSMNDPFGTTDRWTAVEETLLGATDGLVTQMEDMIRFGLQLYTSHNGLEDGDPCPILTGTQPSLGSYDAIRAVFDANRPDDEPPTGAAIQETVTMLADDPDEYEKIIVLATDGEPDTCAEPNPQNGQGEAIQAATDAFNQGYPVYIISVGNDVGETHLQEMANAGQGLPIDDPIGAPYYVGQDAESLQAAFQDILLAGRDCALELEGEVQEGQEERCSVTVDGEPLELNGADGWQLNSPSEMEIVGETCQGILDGTLSEINVACPCGVIIV